jgi:UTP--glucose-1-phosphate uridylyltransferase
MKALIPAAGLGTRWHPWTRVVPKELLPIGNYPAIHYVLEEAVAGGIDEIGIIISKTKRLTKEYVDKVWKLDHPEADIRWFYQHKARGVADALLCAKRWVNDEPVAVLYPDEIHPPEGGIVELKAAYESFSSCWIGLTAEKQERRQAIFEIKETEGNISHVCGFCEKRQTQQIGYGTGRYVLDSGLNYLSDFLSHMKLQEPEEWDDDRVFEPLWEKGVRGIVLSEPIFDIGTPDSFTSAFSAIHQTCSQSGHYMVSRIRN